MLIVTLIAGLHYETCLYVRSMEDHQDADCDEKPIDGCPEYNPGPEGVGTALCHSLPKITESYGKSEGEDGQGREVHSHVAPGHRCRYLMGAENLCDVPVFVQ
jgi:hypothetical protein